MLLYTVIKVIDLLSDKGNISDNEHNKIHNFIVLLIV